MANSYSSASKESIEAMFFPLGKSLELFVDLFLILGISPVLRGQVVAHEAVEVGAVGILAEGQAPLAANDSL